METVVLKLKSGQKAAVPEEITKVFQLKQYTPHIHFQAEEAGACLRASEVKPRLDRFIATFLQRQKCSVPDNWYLPQTKSDYGKIALHYQMHITTTGGIKRGEPAKWTAFFGDSRKTVHCEDSLQMLLTFPEQLTENVTVDGKAYTLPQLVEYVIPAFFALTCFGFRSTKGFGSYGIADGKNRQTDESYLLPFTECGVYYTLRMKGGIKADEQLKLIKTLSDMMKAGINFRGYYKGRIFRYFSEKSVGSDKAFVKHRVLNRARDNHQDSEEKKRYEHYVYSRALLGLAPHYEYRAGKNTGRKGKVTVSDKEKNIGRFNNPVHFIPNGNELILLPTVIPERMFDREFLFNGETIRTPKRGNNVQKGEFDLIAFLDYFMEQFNDAKDSQKEKNALQNLSYLQEKRIKKHFIRQES